MARKIFNYFRELVDILLQATLFILSLLATIIFFGEDPRSFEAVIILLLWGIYIQSMSKDMLPEKEVEDG